MAVRQAPTSVVQNVISALVEDPAELRKTAAAASAAAVLAGPEATDAVDAMDPSADAQAAAQLDADELLKQAEEQAGDQVRLGLAHGMTRYRVNQHRLGFTLRCSLIIWLYVSHSFKGFWTVRVSRGW